MTTAAKPSAMTAEKQARTGRNSSGTIHVGAWWRLVELPACLIKHAGGDRHCRLGFTVYRPVISDS
jgi:hypothetical protein